jgi:GR25 family glycosyltransferase involved in LPS biosynthesis
MLSIGITTFKRRLKSVEDMIIYLKSCDKDIIINLAVNGEVIEEFDENYRKDILSICLKHTNVFPFFYQEFRSLSKLWNNLVISSKTEYNLILNDDLVFDKKQNFVEIIKEIIVKNPHAECFTLNGSWSHFVITKKFLDEMNYFDERFLLHGEEDGDFVWRFIDKFGSYPPSVSLPIVVNLHQTGKDDPTLIAKDTEIGYASKPKFNQEFTVTKYEYDPNSKISGLYGRPHKRILGDERQYPYESFYFKNKENLKKFNKILL